MLVAAALLVFAVAPDVNNVLFVGGWLFVVVGFRIAAATLVPPGGARVLWDSAFLVGCLLAAWEGGWFLIPAGAAFLVADFGRPPSRRGKAAAER